MTSERLGEMFKGDSADTCAGKFPLVLMGGRADTSSVRRRGARTPIGASGNSIKFHISLVDYQKAKWLIFQCDVSLFLVGMNTIRYSMAIFYSNFFLLSNVFLSDKPPFVKYYEFDVSDKTESHKNVAIVIRHTPSHLQTNSVWKLAGYESTLVLVWKVVTWGIFMGESGPVVCIFKYLIFPM